MLLITKSIYVILLVLVMIIVEENVWCLPNNDLAPVTLYYLEHSTSEKLAVEELHKVADEILNSNLIF